MDKSPPSRFGPARKLHRGTTWPANVAQMTVSSGGKYWEILGKRAKIVHIMPPLNMENGQLGLLYDRHQNTMEQMGPLKRMMRCELWRNTTTSMAQHGPAWPSMAQLRSIKGTGGPIWGNTGVLRGRQQGKWAQNGRKMGAV